MKKAPARFALAIAATFVLMLSCYGLARAYLYYEAARSEHMLKELGNVKIGDPESQVLAILRQGNYRRAPENLAKFDKADYEYQTEIGPSGIYYLVDRATTGALYHMSRAILGGLNPRLRRAVGLRRWNVYGRVGIKENRVTLVSGMVMVEGSHEWLAGDWALAETIPAYAVERFVTSPGFSWPHSNRYLVGWWIRLIAMEIKNGGGEGASSWITPAATEDEKRSAHDFRWNCLTSSSGCRTVCDLYPATVEYTDSGTWKERKEACAAPSARNSYW